MFKTRFDKLSELGHGGYATVYKVRDKKYGNLRALRKLDNAVLDTEDKVYKNWERECGILMRLGNGNHPNIVHYGRPEVVDHVAFVDMDFIKGQEVYAYLESQNFLMPLDEVYHMAEQISSALAFCHYDIYKYCMDREKDNLKSDPRDAQKLLIDAKTEARLLEKYKVIHNDIQHRNVMRQFDGRYILIDFGLSIQGETVGGDSSRHKNGVMEYQAPEKWDDESILTEQCDIYSFGVLLYLCLAGQLPFYFNSKSMGSEPARNALYHAHLETTPAPIQPLRQKHYPNAEYSEVYPEWLEAIAMKCLEKDPKKRYQNGKELHEAIVEGLNSMNNVEKVRKEHREAIESLIKQRENELQTLRNQHENELQTLSNQSANEIRVLRKQHENELEKLKKEFEAKLNANKKRRPIGAWVMVVLMAVAVGVLSFCLSDSRERLHDMSYAYLEYKDSVEALNGQIASQESQWGHAKSQSTQQLQEAQSNYQQTKKEVEDLQQQVSALNSQVQDLTAKNNRLTKDLNTARSQKAKAEKEVKSLRSISNL